MMHKDHRTVKAKAVPQPKTANGDCALWAILLPDAAEGLLDEAEGRALDYHLAECAACSKELAEAQRGLAWLTVLKEQAPAPPNDLLANILSRTTGMEETGVMLPPMPLVPVAVAAEGITTAAGTWDGMGGRWRQWLGAEDGAWSRLLQPRLAMTGAMAFFSICLTLDLFGISVTQLDAESFRTGGLQRTVADGRDSLVRSIQGLRVVYRVESRVNEMRAQMESPGDPVPAR